MATFNPYLHFTGNTKEAFDFYKSIFGGEYASVKYFKDLPQSNEHKIPDEYLDKILFITLPIGNGNVLMGSDAMMVREGHKFTYGDNFHIAISVDSLEEANDLFNKLAKGGIVEMPLSEGSLGVYFGMLADKFKVQWTVSFEKK